MGMSDAEKPEPKSKRRRRAVVVLAAGSLLATVSTAWLVISADPIRYGAVFWPFADGVDKAEAVRMEQFADGIRQEAGPYANLAGVPRAMGNGLVWAEVHRPRSYRGTVRMVLRFEVRETSGLFYKRPVGPIVVRCREVLVRGSSGLDVSSRRVDCPPGGPRPGNCVTGRCYFGPVRPDE